MAEVAEQSSRRAEEVISRGEATSSTLRQLALAFVDLGQQFRFL